MEWTNTRRECVKRYFDLGREDRLNLKDGEQWRMHEYGPRDLVSLAEGLFLMAKNHCDRTGKVDHEAWGHFSRVVREMCRRRPKDVAQDLLRLAASHPGGRGESVGNFAAEAYPLAALKDRLGYEEDADQNGSPRYRVDEKAVLAVMEILDVYPKLVLGMLELVEGPRAREGLRELGGSRR